MRVLDPLKQWFADPVESIFLQVPRALAAALLALVVDFAVLEFCIHAFGMSAVPAAILGYLFGTVLQYVLCSLWVFSTAPKGDGLGFLAFMLLSLVGLAITWIVVAVVHGRAGAAIELAKVGAVILAFAWNFLSRKYLLFRGGGSRKEALPHSL